MNKRLNDSTLIWVNRKEMFPDMWEVRGKDIHVSHCNQGYLSPLSRAIINMLMCCLLSIYCVPLLCQMCLEAQCAQSSSVSDELEVKPLIAQPTIFESLLLPCFYCRGGEVTSDQTYISCQQNLSDRLFSQWAQRSMHLNNTLSWQHAWWKCHVMVIELSAKWAPKVSFWAVIRKLLSCNQVFL